MTLFATLSGLMTSVGLGLAYGAREASLAGIGTALVVTLLVVRSR